MTRFARYCLSNAVFRGILLAALALRAVIPIGFMPVADGYALSMQLCTSSGYRTVLVQFGQDGRPAAPTPSHDNPCLYSVCNALAPPPSVVAAAFPPGIIADQSLLGIERTEAQPIARAQSPRGPPNLI